MFVILAAMEKEAKYIDCPNAKVIVTGIGVINVIKTLADKLASGELKLTDKLINVGYAGSNQYEVGDIIAIDKTQRLCPSATIEEPVFELNHFPMENKIEGTGTCFTADDFCNEIINEIPAVDMELYYIKAMGFTNLCSFKIISDNLNYVGYEKFKAEEAWIRMNKLLDEAINK